VHGTPTTRSPGKKSHDGLDRPSSLDIVYSASILTDPAKKIIYVANKAGFTEQPGKGSDVDQIYTATLASTRPGGNSVTSTSSNSSNTALLAGPWTIDPHQTTVEFRTKALWVLPVKGKAKVTGGGAIVGADGSLTGSLVIDAASIDTKNKKRDEHLRTADFFEVSKYPTITFEVTGGRLVSSNKMELEGTLTVHGQTRPLTLSADVDTSRDSAVISTELEIDRRSWGLSLAPFGAGYKNRVTVKAAFIRS
jgi:polyisoprenoid-binding protein YceI